MLGPPSNILKPKMNKILIVIALAVAFVSAQASPCESGWDYFDGDQFTSDFCFKTVHDYETFFDAVVHCERRDSYLCDLDNYYIVAADHWETDHKLWAYPDTSFPATVTAGVYNAITFQNKERASIESTPTNEYHRFACCQDVSEGVAVAKKI